VNDLGLQVREHGHEPLVGGGGTNHVFVHRGRGELLRLAVTDDPNVRDWKTQDFARCREASRRFAPRGLMPEVRDAGENWAGTGCPFLIERFVPGQNLGEAYANIPIFGTIAVLRTGTPAPAVVGKLRATSCR
jgi:hypothetical protein